MAITSRSAQKVTGVCPTQGRRRQEGQATAEYADGWIPIGGAGVAKALPDLHAAMEKAGRDPAAARTWAYAIVGAFQIVTLMWLRDGYCEIDTVADDLTQLLWPGVATAGD